MFPLDDYSVYDNLKRVAMGVQGEIYTGGAGAAAGYLHEEALISEKFVVDPFSNVYIKPWS
jgi:surfactin family lipopeptide synthetase C